MSKENNVIEPLQQMRYGSYDITDNVPGYWIQHSTEGFMCIVPYVLESDFVNTDLVKERALANAQKICEALEYYDDKICSVLDELGKDNPKN